MGFDFNKMIKNVSGSEAGTDEETKFIPTSKVGDLEVDSVNRIFRVKNAKSTAYNKKSSLLGKTALAMATGGLSIMVDGAIGATKMITRKPDSIYKFSELIEFELLEDESQVSKGGVGQALAGGFLFGGFGAIAGGVTGTRITKKQIESMIIKITVNDIDNPLIMLPLILKSTKTKSKEYQEAFNLGHKIMTTLNVIANNK